MNNQPEYPVVNKGYLGVILMRSLNMTYPQAQESVDYIGAYCKRHGYLVVVDKEKAELPNFSEGLDEIDFFKEI